MKSENYVSHYLLSAIEQFSLKNALATNNDMMNYAALGQRIADFSAYFKSQGVKPGDHVAVALPRNNDMVAAILSLFCSGAVYVPLDHNHPQARWLNIIESSECKFLLTNEAITSSAHIMLVSDVSATDEPLCTVDINADDLAYIIHTSGSTGKPKGVMISHGNLYSLVEWAVSQYSQDELAYTLAGTSVGFDLSIFEMFVPLAVGGCVVIAQDNLSLLEQKISQPITLINTVPSVIQALLKADAIPGTVKTVNLAGEQLMQAIVNELYQLAQVSKVYNLYGPSETTTYSTYFLAEQDADYPHTPIGKPIKNTHVMLLDEHNNPVPFGAKGELCITGAGVSLGYYNQQQRSEDSFVDLAINGETLRFYKTGDLARVNSHKVLEYLGRVDHQVKVKGVRIEPVEIEVALTSIDAIQQAVVLTRNEINNGQTLIAYYVSSELLEEQTVMVQLAQKLPAAMVPEILVRMSQMPLNSNGKVDRAKLPMPDLGTSIDISNDEISQVLHKCWLSVLNEEDIKADSNFFFVGGNSLLATRLSILLHENFAISLTLQDFYDHPTFAQQVQLLNAANVKKSRQELPDHAEIDSQLLSSNQRQLWYLQNAQLEKPISNIPIVIKLRGEINKQALEAAFGKLVARHEILRTVYPVVDNQVIQQVNPAAPFTINEMDCTGKSAEEVFAIQAPAANYIFDLTSDLMLRATLYKMGNNDYQLLMVQHHISSDAWSLSNMIKELSVIYNAQLNGEEAVLPEVTQYSWYSRWENLPDNLSAMEQNMDYWLQELHGALDDIKLPFDFPRPGKQSFKGKLSHFVIEKEKVAQLKQVANKQKTSLFTVLYTAFRVLMYRYSHQEDICVGMLNGNRPHSALNSSLGFFVNALPVRARIDGNLTLIEELSNTHDKVNNALVHGRYPFDRLVESLRLNRSVNKHPLFQVLFSLQNTMTGDLALQGATAQTQEYDRGISKFDLTLSMVERQEQLEAIFEYSTELFKESSIERMKLHFDLILNAFFTSNRDCKLTDIPLNCADEIQRNLIDINQTSRPYAKGKCVAEVFEETAAKYPDNIALVTEHVTLTYAELNQRANQYANLLKSKNLQVGAPVAIMLHKGAEALIAMLGIVKVGSHFVPLDPDWPIRRLSYILDDTDTAAIITNQELSGLIPATIKAKIIRIDAAKGAVEQYERELDLEGIERDSEDLCYVMYTSGSTGKPKGVKTCHKGVVSLVDNVDYVTLNENSVLLQVSPLPFDGSTFDIWGSWLNGGKLIVPPKGVPSLDGLAELLVKHQVNTLFTTTQLFNSLVDYRLNDMASIKQLMFGGEVASTGHVAKFKAAYPETMISNIYGPTETTTFAISYPIPGNFDRLTPLPLGKPLTNNQVVILSDKLQLCPTGVRGEICIGGEGVAKGYLNKKSLTVQSFIDNPIKELDCSTLYRTGDIGYYNEQGDICFVGRVDNQIKLRGYRIELAEIEYAVRDIPGILDCIVVVQRPDDYLVTYVTVDSNIVSSDKEIRQQLSVRLSKYMVPDFVEILPSFPLNENGKIDKSLLPNVKPKHSESGSEIALHIMDDARSIYNIWAEVLEDDEITYDDHFFEIGGNSIKLVAVLEELKKHYADNAAVMNKLTIASLFEYASIADLVGYLFPKGEEQTEVQEIEVDTQAISESRSSRRDKRRLASEAND